jgi:glycosyltransferase involved in cell wall biosynthesis
MSGVRASFCATNLNTRSTLTESLSSIERIGQGVGGPFEVVVADGPSEPETRAILDRWGSAASHHVVVRHGLRNRGYGRRQAFEASSGTYIVPFDTSIVYEPTYATLLERYLRLATERMLFSEVCALKRDTVEAVGGWRDLIGGEDVDVYGPVAERYGLLAYPTGEPHSQSRVMSSFERQMRYAHGSRLRRLYRMFLTQRDQIIGGNYRIADLMDFNRAKPLGVRAGARLWFTAASVAAACGPIPRRKVDGMNNYLFVRELTIDSMVRGDFAQLGWTGGPPPRLPLTADEKRYLSLRSEIWRIASHDHPELFPDKR